MATFDFRRFRWALTAIPDTSFRHNAQHCSAWSILLSHGCHGASRTARVHLRERLFPPPPDLPGSPARFADRGGLCRKDRLRSRRGTILTWSRELSFGYFSKPPMIAWVIRAASAVCGDGEVCIRASSPVLYTLASLMIYLSGRALFDTRVGFWSATVFATVPGVSYSSLLITTDVPLILFWTIALYAWIMLVKRQSMGFAILLGVAVGLGLLAKQAMIYVVLCIGCRAAVSREARQALKGGRAIVAALLELRSWCPLKQSRFKLDVGF